jgi:hypothetical protein
LRFIIDFSLSYRYLLRKIEINIRSYKMIQNLKLSLIYFLILVGCTTDKQGFSVGEPQTIYSYQQRKELGLQVLGAGFWGLNDNDQWKWFGTHGDWKVLYSIGPKDNPFDSIITKSGPFKGLPEPWSDEHPWGNCSWIANVYLNPENGHILGFIHLESNPPGGTRKVDYFRFGLAISKDGGRTFNWCGYIIEPDLSYETWFNHWYPKGLGGLYSCMGFANYIIKDGYFYIYYMDTKDVEIPDTSIIQDLPNNGVAVARARVEDVLKKAEFFKTANWNKYYQGKWDEEGLGGRFTPLNIKPKGFMHGDAAYNSYLDKYILVTRTGKHVKPDGGAGKTSSVLISFSSDGLHWSEWQAIHKDNHLHDYPAIMSTGTNNEVTGKSFWVYYKYDYGAVLPERSGRKKESRWDRILITLE